MNDVQAQEYMLLPGYLILPVEPVVIYMVLGSCVAVILHDRRDKRSGCCHFIEPRTPAGHRHKPTYGTVAVLTLVRLFLETGSSPGDIEAQVVGGSDLPGHITGRENVEVAVKILNRKGIHISSMDVGGDKGRKVIYNTENNHLAVIKVDRIRANDWYPGEV